VVWRRSSRSSFSDTEDKKKKKVYFPRYNNTAVKTDSNKTQSGGLPEETPYVCLPFHQFQRLGRQ